MKIHINLQFFTQTYCISAPSVANSEQLQGKQLSYNNLLDFDAALAIVMEFDDPTAVIVKHNNPCGVASSETLLEAFNNAMKTDPQSAFGGIISFNREVNASLAKEIIFVIQGRYNCTIIF